MGSPRSSQNQKGRPAQVKVYQFPFPDESDGQTCAKSFYRAQDCKLTWSPHGHGVLVQTHTDVDATGGSYYGGTSLYLMQSTPKKKGEPAFERGLGGLGADEGHIPAPRRVEAPSRHRRASSPGEDVVASFFFDGRTDEGQGSLW